MSLSPSPERRVYVDASLHGWHRMFGTDYILSWANATAYAGWTYTGTPTLIANTGVGDLFSLADHDPIGLQLATTASAQSARFQELPFGTYNHLVNAANILGYTPTRLVMTIVARFSVASANEAQTGFGLVNTTSATSTNAQKVAWIASDGTNFVLRSNTSTDTGAAVDTNWHEWQVAIDATNTEWFIDGVSQGSFATVSDIWGGGFQVNGPASRTNVPQVSTVHVRYE